jgi:DnaJ-like protein
VSVPDSDIASLHRSYQILGVQPAASPLAIKSAYRTLTKRWHPDLYPSGTEQYRDAVEMMKLINGAYSDAEQAPLRYMRKISAQTVSRTAASRASTAQESRITPEFQAKVEFWTRFVFGASSWRCSGTPDFSDFTPHAWLAYPSNPHRGCFNRRYRWIRVCVRSAGRSFLVLRRGQGVLNRQFKPRDRS